MESESTQDMFQAFAKAREIFEAMGLNDENAGTKEKISQMLQMMELMKNLSKTTEKTTEKTYKYYDEPIHTPAMRSIKSAIPYLEPEYQRSMGIFMKFIELKKLLEAYSSKMISMQSGEPGDWRKNMLLAVRPHMEEDKKEKIDMLVKMIDMKEMLDLMNILNPKTG